METTFSNIVAWIKSSVFWLQFHGNLFPGVTMTKTGIVKILAGRWAGYKPSSEVMMVYIYIYIYIHIWWGEDAPPKGPLTQNDCTWHDVIINSLGLSNRTWSSLVHVIACCLFCAKSLHDSFIVKGTYINYILSNKVTFQLFLFNNIILIINCSYLMMSPIGQWVNMWTIENYWRCKMHLG